MKLINSKFKILPQENTIWGIYEQIENAGRTCYKSENNIQYDYYDFDDKLITPNEEAYQKGWCKRKSKTAKSFVDMLIKSGHGAMLEHGTVYLQREIKTYSSAEEFREKYLKNKYSKVYSQIDGDFHDIIYVTTNFRVLVENDWLDDLEYICEPTEYHEKRITVKFTCDIGVSREFNRHRVNSPAEQSTRYCNYSKNKFNNELSIIRPGEINIEDINNVFDNWSSVYGRTEDHTFRTMCNYISDIQDDEFGIVETWLFANLASQWSYMRLLKLGWKPEQARRVLPLDLKTELVHTAFIDDWKHFFNLRCDKSAHPDARELAIPLKKEFIKYGYIRDTKI